MDRVARRRSPWRRRLALSSGAVVVAAAGAFLLHRSSQRGMTVEASRLTIGRVIRGKFDDFIEVRGKVTPLRTTFVDTASGGQVEAILVDDGAHVKRGQPLVKLQNTKLQLDLISREAQITEQLNNLRGLELTQEQNRLVHEREMVEINYQIERLSRHLAQEQLLVDRGISPRNDLADMKDELAYQRKRKKVQAKNWAAADKLQKAQLGQLRVAAKQLQKNLAVARRNLASLNVVAPSSGELSGFTLEVGQSLSPGDRIAQIDDPDHYKVVADIDEFYLPRVATGQHARTRLGGTRYPLTVAKIRPQVESGRFQVELVFTEHMPEDVRRGQTAEVHLELGQPDQAVLVPNAAFYNDTGGAWVFVLSSDHRRAVRRKVRLGRRNPRYIEVLGGLSVGEEIVTSPYTDFLHMDTLELTQ